MDQRSKDFFSEESLTASLNPKSFRTRPWFSAPGFYDISGQTATEESIIMRFSQTRWIWLKISRLLYKGGVTTTFRRPFITNDPEQKSVGDFFSLFPFGKAMSFPGMGALKDLYEGPFISRSMVPRGGASKELSVLLKELRFQKNAKWNPKALIKMITLSTGRENACSLYRKNAMEHGIRVSWQHTNASSPGKYWMRECWS